MTPRIAIISPSIVKWQLQAQKLWRYNWLNGTDRLISTIDGESILLINLGWLNLKIISEINW